MDTQSTAPTATSNSPNESADANLARLFAVKKAQTDADKAGTAAIQLVVAMVLPDAPGTIIRKPADPREQRAFMDRVAAMELEMLPGGLYRVRNIEEIAGAVHAAVAAKERIDADILQRHEADQLAARAAAAQKFWEASGVPPRYFHADIQMLGDVPQGYNGAAEDIKECLAKPRLFAMIGGRGPGKTHLGCALVREFCRNGRRAKYTRAMDIFRSIRATYGKGSTKVEADVIAPLARVDLLVVDEVQVRSDSDWENAVLTDLIDARYNALKSTILIANFETKQELTDSLGPSIASRLTQTGHTIRCTWESLRKSGKAVEPSPPQMNGDNPVYQKV